MSLAARGAAGQATTGESAAMQRTETGKILFGHFCQKIP
jgi:hypothetical protein